MSANGASFHVAEAGDGPLVLLLHGFPTYWWTWRAYLPALAAAGYRVAAMDLRGYGGSDHTPRGYDPFSSSRDIVSVIRSLGAAQATIIGHGWGAFLAWTTAALHPDAVTAIAPISMAHPARLRSAMINDRAQQRASAYVLGFQRPWVPERALVADRAARISGFLRDWSANPTWLTTEVDSQYRAAFMHSNTAHCALEYHRWALRSIPRADGRRFDRAVRRVPIAAPVLQLHGAADRTVLPRTATGSQQFTRGPFAWRLLSDTGHFPHEEAAERTLAIVTQWLADGCDWQDRPELDQLRPR